MAANGDITKLKKDVDDIKTTLTWSRSMSI